MRPYLLLGFTISLASACATATDSMEDGSGGGVGSPGGADTGGSSGTPTGGTTSTGGTGGTGGTTSTGGTATGGGDTGGADTGGTDTGGADTGGTDTGGTDTGGTDTGGGDTGGSDPGSGGGMTGPCESVTCGGQSYPAPTSDICVEFTTGQHGGWQLSNGQGCSVTVDGAPITVSDGTYNSNMFPSGSHTIEFEGCTNPNVAWSCWS